MTAISTMHTYLMHKTASGTAYQKLVDIKKFPDLGGKPETLETTTLSDEMQTNINGVQKVDALEFTANYNKADYSTLLALSGKQENYAVWIGSADGTTPDGSNGKFEFTGELSVYVNSGDVNKVTEMTITINASTKIAMATA